jgi:AcrR family transcriptional regulator
MTARVPTRGSRRRARTRAALTAAGAELIAEKGVAGLRIQEITERADVALGSFYNHFKTKDELVEAVVADTIEVRAEAIVARMASIEDPAEVVSFACRQVIRIAYDEPELAWLFVHLDRANVLFEGIVLPYWMETLERGIAAGRFEIRDAHIALTAVTGAAIAVMRAVLEGRYGDDADALFAEGVLRSLGVSHSETCALLSRGSGRSAPESM